ncbi:methyl-accepting chemotaxis protein [Natronobacillus azotifigens]|uniref:Methyl-accepting chemotaxis protein n=1 Tax=Natronobacillus azotifigens TaxID=472978 RepID=A0A9J6RAG7_9BACI|nr:methyl-accepting chemotaxis protein [Natronobacillus azotifigens]MCZ0702300.1 methyl-accepting chemotaxis protein [Natronobacillus azotifigens]
MRKISLNTFKNKRERHKKFTVRNLSIGWKYGVGLLVIFLLLCASTVLIARSMMATENAVETLERDGNRAVLVTELESQIRAKTNVAFSYIQFGSEVDINNYEERMEEVNLLLDQLREQLHTEPQESLFAEGQRFNEDMDQIFFDEVIPRYGTSGHRELYSSQLNTLTSRTTSFLGSLRELINEERQIAVEHANESTAFAFIMLITSMLFTLITGVILVLFISQRVSYNLKKVVVLSDHIANGNLTVDSLTYKGKDEIGKLSSSINVMKQQLLTMIQQISQSTSSVSTQSEQLSHSAHQVKSGAKQIATTMEELAKGTESQASYSSELATSMKAFAAEITEMSEKGQSITQSTERVLTETSEGQEYMNQSVDQIGNIDTIVKKAVEKVKGLDKQSKLVTNLVAVIKDIAGQTNLLALNAAIEAARAGESGKGFAVVADEVRKLAEQVDESVGDITKIVKTIQGETGAVVHTLELCYEEVLTGTEKIESTGTKFEYIEEAVKNMTDNVNSVMSGLNKIAEESEQMNHSVQEIAAISEQSAAGVEETTASAEEAFVAMEDMSTRSNLLNKTSESLSEVVQQFNI